jgi:hypothetical protein
MRRAALVLAVLAVTGCGGSDHNDHPTPAGTWSTPERLPADAPPTDADVAARRDGTAVGVWVDRAPRAHRVLVAERDADGGWTTPTQIGPTSPTPIVQPTVVLDADGTPTAAWVLWDRPAGAVFAFVQTSSRQPDGRWQNPVTLSRGTNGLTRVLAAATPDGGVVVVWSGSTRRNGSYAAEVRSASRLTGGRWVFARVAGLNQGDPYLVEGALSGTGSVRVIWPAFQRRGHPAGVRAARRGADGRWSPPRIVAPGEARDMAAATGPDGTITAAWSDPSGPHIARSHPDNQGTQILNLGSARRQLGVPTVAAGAHGDALVAFQDQTTRTGAHPGLWLIHVSRDGTTSAPTRIAAARMPPRTGAFRVALSWDPALTLAPDGRGLIAWPRLIPRPRSQATRAIDARLISTDGATGPREEVARFSPPLPYLSAQATSLSDGRFALRWNQPTPTGGRGEPWHSERSP